MQYVVQQLILVKTAIKEPMIVSGQLPWETRSTCQTVAKDMDIAACEFMTNQF